MNSPTKKSRFGIVKGALTTLLVVLVLVVGSVAFFREQVGVAALRIVLKDYGIALHEARGLQWSTQHLHFSSLSMTLPGAQSVSLVKELNMRFDVRELLKGELQEVSIASAVLHLEVSDTEPGTASNPTPFAVPDFAPVIATLMQFPIASTRVDSLSLTPWLEDATLSLIREPRELVGTLDVDELHAELRANWHDADFVSSYFIPETDVDLHPMAAGTVTGSLDLVNAGSTAIHAEFSALQTSEGLSLDAAANASLADMTTIALREFPALTGITGLTGALSMRLHTSISTTPGAPLQLAIQIDPTNVRLPLGSEPLLLDIEHLSIQGLCRSTQDCTMTQSSSLHLTTLNPTAATPPPLFTALHMTSAGDLAMTEDGISVTMTPASVVALDGLSIGAVQLRNITMALQDTLRIQWDGADKLDVQNNGMSLGVADFGVDEIRGSAQLNISVLLASGALSSATLTDLDTSFRILGLSTNALPFSVRNPELSAHITLLDTIARLEGELQVASRPMLQATASFDMDSSTGTAQLSVPAQTFDANANTLASLFVSQPLPGDIVAGSLQADASLHLRVNEEGKLAAEGPLSLQLRELSGFVGETAIVGLSAELKGNLQDDYSLITTAPVLLTLASVDPGIAITDIHAQIDVDTRNNMLQLTDLEATLFNGKARSKGGSFELEEPDGTLILELERIDLSSILALGAYDGVTASGLVSGSLPAQIRDGAVSIAGGTLHAESPGGNIRYEGSGGPTGNAALDFVNQTLNNYQYDVMDAGVDYAPAGDLSLSLKLQGINPDNNPGQRINLNLNISDNIPTLLRSLQAGRTITDAVEQQLRNR